MTEVDALKLETLFADLPGLPQSFASLYYEALQICLGHSAHESGVECEIRSLDEVLSTLKLVWIGSVDDKARRAWGEPMVAVEYAAVGVAYLTMPELTGYTVIECANVGDGIDFWLGYESKAHQQIFQRRGRLEVSGILRAESAGRIRQRVREKLKQTERSDYTGLPAFVVVSEFGGPLIFLERRQ